MPAPYNPREMREHDFEQLKASLTEYGLVQPVVCNKRTPKHGWKKADRAVIVGGHQRVRAASDIELENLEVKWVDLDARRERALNLILNRNSGDWEEEALERALREIEELGGDDALAWTGFTQAEIDHYLGTPDGNEGGGDGGGGGANFSEPNDDTDHECPKCGYRFK